MANRSFDERNVRTLSRSASGSYYITVPIEYIKSLKWRERQKLMVELTKDGIQIVDWKK